MFKRKIVPMPCKVKNLSNGSIHGCTEKHFTNLMTKRRGEFEAIEAPEELLKQINIKIIENDPHKKILGDKQDVVEINPLPEKAQDENSDGSVRSKDLTAKERDEQDLRQKLLDEVSELGLEGKFHLMKRETIEKKIAEARKEKEKKDIKDKLLTGE